MTVRALALVSVALAACSFLAACASSPSSARPRAPPRTAEEVVQAQLEAYNAQDLEAFLATYAEDAVIVKAGTGEVMNAGLDSLRERYGKMFQKYPANRARIAERRVEGDVVHDHEIITGRGPERPDPWDVGWVRYEVSDGKIRRVTLP